MALDFKVMKSPWVIGAGLVLGLVVLTLKGGGTSSGDNGAGVGTDYAAAINNYGQSVVNAQAQVAIAQSGATAQNIQSIIGYLNNTNQVNAMASVANNQTYAGIEQTRIQSMTSYLMDQSDNLARMGQAYLSADTANRQTDAAIQIASIQNSAAMQIAKTNASATKDAAITGGITSLISGLGGSLLKGLKV